MRLKTFEDKNDIPFGHCIFQLITTFFVYLCRLAGADLGFLERGFNAVHTYKGVGGSFCLFYLFFLKYPMEMK